MGQVNSCVETINPSCGGGGGNVEVGKALGRIHVGVCYTPGGARPRRWCGWWGRRGLWGQGVGGNCSTGMDGSKKIVRRYSARRSVYYSGGFLYQVRRLSKRERGNKKGGGFERFRLHEKIKYTSAMRSRTRSKLILATSCVILQSGVLIIYVGACYTRGAGSRQSCGVWGRTGRWRG